MTEDAKANSPPNERPEGPVCGVLVLPSPPGALNPEEWYQKKIVGVPFLLLNVLNLQRGGVDRLMIYHPAITGPATDALSRLMSDSRVKGRVEWIADAGALAQVLADPNCHLVANGAALHDKDDIAAALGGSLDPQQAEAGGFFRVSRDAARQVSAIFERAGEYSPSGMESPGQTGDSKNDLLAVSGGENRVRRDGDFKSRHERLLMRAGMASDSFMDRWVSRHCSRLFTRWLIDTPVTPNQITWMHILVGSGSAWFFYQGSYFWVAIGAVLLMISSWLDATDGELARLRFQQSRFGMILDIIGDNVVHWAVFLGIGFGAARATGNEIFIYCGVLSALGALISFLLLQASVFRKRGGGDYEPSGWADELANRDFLYFLFVMALANQLDLFIAITAVGSNAFAGFVLYKKMKTS